jgi:HTH-type transcriptional regulator / antitoxin HipB
MRDIQQQIREAREAKQLTQSELGRLVGQPQSSVSRIERGGDVRLSTLLEMARILDLEPWFIPKRLVPAVQALIQYAADPDPSQRPAQSQSSPLAGGVPEDAEDE